MTDTPELLMQPKCVDKFLMDMQPSGDKVRYASQTASTNRDRGETVQFISAEQFVGGLIATLRLQGKTEIDLQNPMLDEQFALAYNELLASSEELGIVPDFVISPDPDFGDSTCLRDTILSIRDLRTIALNNPRFVTLTIQVDTDAAAKVLEYSAVPKDRLKAWASKYLEQIAH